MIEAHDHDHEIQSGVISLSAFSLSELARINRITRTRVRGDLRLVRGNSHLFCQGDVVEIRNPYLMFLGDAPDQLAAKTANGVKVWRKEWCIGQFRLPDARPILTS